MYSLEENVIYKMLGSPETGKNIKGKHRVLLGGVLSFSWSSHLPAKNTSAIPGIASIPSFMILFAFFLKLRLWLFYRNSTEFQ